MTRRPNLTKAITEAKAAGMNVTRAEILPDGRIILSEAKLEPESPYDVWKRTRGEGRPERPA